MDLDWESLEVVAGRATPGTQVLNDLVGPVCL